MKKAEKSLNVVLALSALVLLIALLLFFRQIAQLEQRVDRVNAEFDEYVESVEPTAATEFEPLVVLEPVKPVRVINAEIISTEPETPVEQEPAPPEVDPDELEMLACTIYREAGEDACTDDTRMKVGNVVLNRVSDERFPDTMYDVLTQERQYGLFHWTGISWGDRADDPNEAAAVERAYKCARRLLEGERVLDSAVVWQAEFPQGVETVSHQDGIYFCR